MAPRLDPFCSIRSVRASCREVMHSSLGDLVVLMILNGLLATQLFQIL